MTRRRRDGMSWSVAFALCALANTARAEPSATTTREPSPASEAKPKGCDPARESGALHVGRVAAAVLTGTSVASIGFVAGPELTGAACRRCLYAAGLAGASAGFPIGVVWGGGLVRGKGSFWLTVAAPWLVSGATLAALIFDRDYDGSSAFKIGAIGGASAAPLSVVLYEITHARRQAKVTREAPAPQISIDPHRHGAAVRFAGQF